MKKEYVYHNINGICLYHRVIYRFDNDYGVYVQYTGSKIDKWMVIRFDGTGMHDWDYITVLDEYVMSCLVSDNNIDKLIETVEKWKNPTPLTTLFRLY